MKIAIQGKNGSYHSIAAKGIFGQDAQLIDAGVFSGVFDLVESGEVDYGVVAIENTIFGTIRSVYDLLSDRKLHVVGETYVKISHVLAASELVKLTDILIVRSQKEAIAACTKWIKVNLPNAKLHYGRDTAESLEQLIEGGNINVAAIGSKVAAEDLGLKILAENITDNKDTDTRFVVVSKSPESILSDADKTSVLLKLGSQEKGSLLKVLQKIADANINITKIESRPEPGKKWSYMFYIDLESGDQKVIQPLFKELNLLGSSIETIGSYKKSSLVLGSD